jgi:regulator of sigma E protease
MLHVTVAVLSLGALVLLHEAGHFVMARLCRMRVDVFSIGFGPALLSYRGPQTEYRLSMIPLGGYVRIAGMAPGDFPPDDPASFMARPAWQRLLVLVAGPVTNWGFAAALLAALYAVGFSVPTGEPVIEEVRSRVAAAAGLLPGDRVLEVEGDAVASWSELTRSLAARASQTVDLKVKRNDVELMLSARLGPDGLPGLIPRSRVQRYPAWLAVGKTWDITVGMLSDLRDFLGGHSEAQLIGPVGIVTDTVEAVRTGSLQLVFILVQISLGLSVMNLLPLPALDGGRLLFVLLGVVRRRPVDVRIEAVTHALGVLALLGMLVWISWGEIGKLLPRGSPSAPDASEARRPQ